MTGHGAGRAAPAQAALVAVSRTADPSVPRPDWTGRVATHRLLLLQPFLHLVPTSCREEAAGSPPPSLSEREVADPVSPSAGRSTARG